MLPCKVIAYHFSWLTADNLAVVLELRNIIAKIQPNAVEEIRSQGLVYYDAIRGGPVSAGICQILLNRESLRLAFAHGSFLPDPEGLLQREGECLYKRTLPLLDYENVPWQAVEDLILPNEIHGFLRYDSWLRAYTATARFLTEKLKP